MLLSDFDYELPDELIAQHPEQNRDASKMMVLNRQNKSVEHRHFYDITDYFESGDVLVLNNTKVIPARLLGNKTTGAKVEIFLLKPLQNTLWEALLKPAKRLKINEIIKISEALKAKIIEKNDENALVELIYKGNIFEVLEKYGNIPLPPYIARAPQEIDISRYQTVFAQKEGSVAAPTAGLHFTEEILKKLKNKGVKICYITLDVGLGTFRPVKCENFKEHKMHFESYEICSDAAKIINEAKRVTAVGTTCVRTLESCFAKFGKIKAVRDESNLFIYPPYEFKVVDRLLTNFHLPKSTLLMLVSAFAEYEYVKSAYKCAVLEKYRFFSYGDCMFIS